MSDRPEPEYLQQPVRADGPIFLADPDPAWFGQYAREEKRIRTAWGQRANLIEHVGSTSVPALAAKPVIMHPDQLAPYGTIREKGRS